MLIQCLLTLKVFLDPEANFHEALNNACHALFSEVFMFADQVPHGLYGFMDYTRLSMDTFVKIDGKFYRTIALHLPQELKRFG